MKKEKSKVTVVVNHDAISLDKLNDCALSNMKKIMSLSTARLNKKYKLPCECGHAILKSLLQDYACSNCNEIFYYSFCLGEVIDANSMWHCNDCKTCREDSEWHCKKCGTCTWGLTLPCDNCGKKSPYAFD